MKQNISLQAIMVAMQTSPPRCKIDWPISMMRGRTIDAFLDGIVNKLNSVEGGPRYQYFSQRPKKFQYRGKEYRLVDAGLFNEHYEEICNG